MIRFAGYAALFDRVDRAGDVIRRGAFQGAGPVPLLLQHRGAPVGRIEALHEDERGLRVAGSIADPALVAEVRAGALAGLSVGYRPLAVRQGARRELTAGGTPSGWAAETGPRPETGTPTFVEIAPPMGELYANPSASQAMLDDAGFDVEEWLAHEIAAEFASAEGSAFVNGSGVNRPRGFLQQPVAATADATRPFGTIQYLASGAAGDFGAGPQERLIDLVQSLRPGYRQGAVFVMNAATLARLRKFKTSDGAFVWQPSLAAGQPATLLGYPVIEAEDMPDIAANSLAIAFGNFRMGYLIAERSETAILRDPYSNKPFVGFYATKRIGGCVTNAQAIKLMKFAAN